MFVFQTNHPYVLNALIKYGIINEKGGDPMENKEYEYDRYEDMIKTFASVVRGEIENPYSVEYELELFTAILKCCGADTEI